MSSIETPAFQILESREADFENMTWTFTLGSGNHVGAGRYAILPYETFMKMSTRLAHTEGLLQQWRGGHLDEGFKERVERHFDPEPFV